MKKIYAVLAVLFFAVASNAQCTVDSLIQPTSGIHPKADSLPCIVRQQFYDQTLQVHCPTYFDSVIDFGIASYPVAVTVDSIELDSIIGLPAGISWSKSSQRLLGGHNGCLNLTGTTNDAPGLYHLIWYGTVWGTLPSPVPAQFASQVYTGNMDKLNYMNYSLGVINSGGACPVVVSGINELATKLNASIHIYPNPNAGNFDLQLISAVAITGEIIITDMAGKAIHSQLINSNGFYSTSINLSAYSSGIYTVLVNSAEGTIAAKFVLE